MVSVWFIANFSIHAQTSELGHGGYVVQTDRSAWGPLSSLRILWTRNGNKQLYGAYERPPFPIKVDQPTLADIGTEFRSSDLVMLFSIYGAGIAWSYFCSRPFPMITQRLVVFHGLSHMFLVGAAALTFTMPYRRLTGYADNGLRWTTPADKLKKFDATSHFENATIWGRFRVRPDDQWLSITVVFKYSHKSTYQSNSRGFGVLGF